MTSTILPLLARFRTAFSSPTFENFQFLLVSWLMNPDRGWLSNCLRTVLHMPHLVPTTDGQPKHFSCFYRFFTRARWSKDRLGKLLANALDRWLPEELTVIVDDTLCRRSGPMIVGAGMHHDPLQTNKRGGSGRRFSFGLNFVIVAVWIPVDFIHSGGIAVPVLFRLYRSKKTCPAELHHTRPQLAVQLLRIVRRWWPNRRIEVTADDAYICKTVFEAVDENMIVTGALQFRYVLKDPQVPESSGRGRPFKWGPRLGTIDELRDDKRFEWQEVDVRMYGQTVSLLTKTIQACWSSTGPDMTVTVLITRDPTGTYEDRCFLRGEPGASVQSILTPVCRRWSLEVTIRDGKQHLSIEQIENGYVHRDQPADSHRKSRPGPQVSPDEQPVASRRTTPVMMLGFGFVVWWYLQHGKPDRDLKWAKMLAPWWSHKTTISFHDMLQAFRRKLESEDLWTNPPQQGFDEKYWQNLPFDWPRKDIPDEQAA